MAIVAVTQIAGLAPFFEQYAVETQSASVAQVAGQAVLAPQRNSPQPAPFGVVLSPLGMHAPVLESHELFSVHGKVEHSVNDAQQFVSQLAGVHCVSRSQVAPGTMSAAHVPLLQ